MNDMLPTCLEECEDVADDASVWETVADEALTQYESGEEQSAVLIHTTADYLAVAEFQRALRDFLTAAERAGRTGPFTLAEVFKIGGAK